MINDFIEYWSATKLLLSGGNPYSPAELLAQQQSLGSSHSEPIMMWNPPWTFFFTLPFGLLDYQISQFAWFLSHTLIIFVGAQWMWTVYGGDPTKSRYATISVLTFAPVYFVLLFGQIGPLILLGLMAFLACQKQKAWVPAAASLMLAAIKPHLVYLVWLALVFWTVKKAQWKLAFAFIVSAMIVASLPLVFDRNVYRNYWDSFEAGEVTRPLNWATPSVGTAIAELFAIPDAWIRFLPSLCGALWFLWYWSRHAQTWDWTLQLPLLLLVSVATASFVWTFDHVVLAPAVIQAAVWTSQEKAIKNRAILISMHIGIAVILVLCKIFVRNDFWYFWAGPAYLLIYLYARATIESRINSEHRSMVSK
jgi:hypothetical protein